MEERGDQRVQVYRTTAEFLATITPQRLGDVEIRAEDASPSDGPRRAVIYTEYDLPRDVIQPHDVVVDRAASPGTRASASSTSGPRSQDRQGHEYQVACPSPASRPGSSRSGRPRGEPVDGQHVPGDHRQVRSQDHEVRDLGAAQEAELDAARSTW